MHANLLVQDEIRPSGKPSLTPGQIGLLSGWGVFTTLRIYDGVPFAFERHWERMSRDAALLNVKLPGSREKVRRRLLRLIAANQAFDAVMRVCVVRNTGGFWAGPGPSGEPTLVALTSDLPQWRESVALDLVEHGRHAASPFAGTKTLSWAHNLTLAENAAKEGFGEALLLNERGEAAECTSANIFAVIDGVTCTPPLSSGPLPGVTRAIMLEELRLPSFPVAERVLRPEEIYAAGEVFITSTTRHLLPVERIRDRRVGKGEPRGWPVMHSLQAALGDYISAYVRQVRETVKV